MAPRYEVPRDDLKHKHMSGRRSDIWLHGLLLMVPLPVFDAILLGLVFHYRVMQSPSSTASVTSSQYPHDSGVYFVDLSATLLVFIASWSSTLGPVLVTSIATLASYVAARQAVVHHGRHDGGRLTSPYQLALLVSLLNSGSVGALWKWISYLVGWRKDRQAQGRALSTAGAIVVVATFLSFLVFLADTWLHVTTTSANFIRVQPLSSMPNYGFGWSSQCANQSFAKSCSLEGGGSGAAWNVPGTLDVLYNRSLTTSYSTFGDDVPYTYLAPPPTDATALSDWTANSFAIQTQCTPITRKCGLFSVDDASSPFYCTAEFSGDLKGISYNLPTVFTDASLAQNLSIGYSTSTNATNPYYMGWVAAIAQGQGNCQFPSNDPGLYQPLQLCLGFILACNVTVYDLEYTMANGTVSGYATKLSNFSVPTTMLTNMLQTGSANSYLDNQVALATYANQSQLIADQMALAYSQAALSMFAGATQPIPALRAQTRESLLVTRVPMGPLWTLVLCNLLFAVAGVVLLTLALLRSDAELRGVQARLTIHGLVADLFEKRHGAQAVVDPDDLFEEHHGHGRSQVGIGRSTEGGYKYVIVDNTHDMQGLTMELEDLGHGGGRRDASAAASSHADSSIH